MEPYSTRISTLRSCTHGYSLALDSGPSDSHALSPLGSPHITLSPDLERLNTETHAPLFPTTSPCGSPISPHASLLDLLPHRIIRVHLFPVHFLLVIQSYSPTPPPHPSRTQPSILRTQLHQQHVWPIHPRLCLRCGEGRAHPPGRDAQRPPLRPCRRTRRRAQPRCPPECG